MSQDAIDIPPPPAALFAAMEKNRHSRTDLLAMLCSTAAPMRIAPGPGAAPAPPAAATTAAAELSAEEIAAFEAAANLLTPEHLRISEVAPHPAIAPVAAPDAPPPIAGEVDASARASRDAWAALGDALGRAQSSASAIEPLFERDVDVDVDASELFLIAPGDVTVSASRGVVPERRLPAARIVKGASVAAVALALVALVRIAAGGSAEESARAAQSRGARAFIVAFESKSTGMLSRTPAAPPPGPVAAAARSAKPRRR
jgi:hypothetical protein